MHDSEAPTAEIEEERAGARRRLVHAGLLLSSVPLPLMAVLQFYGGGIGDGLLSIVTWSAGAILYWATTATVLTMWQVRPFIRFPAALVLSVPLFLLALIVTYPGMGARFGPSSSQAWTAYLSTAPWIFVYAIVLYFLVRKDGRAARVTRRVLVGAATVGLLTPFVLLTQVEHYNWPTRPAVGGWDARIVGARIVDVAEGLLLEDHNVILRDGRIAAIVPENEDTSSLPEIDADGGYLTPGLIDVHTHLEVPVSQATAGLDPWFLFEAVTTGFAQNRRGYLEHGVTTIRDLGGVARSIFRMRASVADHKRLGPRILATGRLVSSRGGHPQNTIWMHRITARGAILAETETELIAGLTSNYNKGPADVVKLIYGTIGRDVTRLDESLLLRGIGWARAQGVPSVVHAETLEEVTTAIRAGATGIEHAASIESLPESLIQETATRGTFVTPTFGELYTVLVLSRTDDDVRVARMRDAYKFILRMFQGGVRLAAGSDAPLVPYGDGLVQELEHLNRAGISAADVLRIGTMNNAAYLGRSDRLGRITTGYQADLILLRENPLESVAALRTLQWVMRNGVIVARPGGR